jgi:hypothetical protein
LNVPKPVRVTSSPLDNAFVISSKTVANASEASFFVIAVFLTIASTMSLLSY